MGLANSDGTGYTQFGEPGLVTTQDAPSNLTEIVSICAACSAQTITASNPKRLVLRLNVTNVAGNGILLKYDAPAGTYGDDTSLDTPLL